MKEAFEKIRKRIEDVRMGYFLTIANGGDERNDVVYEGISKATDHALSIVSEVEAEYGNGKTNADKIRSMSDEELAEFIGSLGACISKDDEYCYKFKNCNDCRLEWLKSEVGCE